ncbi:MAG: SRPBCC family protein, partial [Bacteroidales bacterium]
MKTLLKLLYLLVALLIVLMLAGIFLPKETYIESHTGIAAPVEIVYDQVNDFRNWENWSPWFEADPSMTITYGDRVSGTGASFSWSSDEMGSGNQVIRSAEPGRSIFTNIDFGNQGDADGIWKFQSKGSRTEVIWAFENNDPDYFERYFMFLFQNSIRNDLSMGLENLRKVCE